MASSGALIISLLAVVGFGGFILHGIAVEPLSRSILGPAMEVDQGSKVITLLVPVIARVALPLLCIVGAVGAGLFVIAWIASLDALVYRWISGLFASKAQ